MATPPHVARPRPDGGRPAAQAPVRDTAGGGARGGGPELPPAPKHRRSWGQRLLIAANVFVAMCLVVTAAGYGYVRWRFEQVPTVSGLKSIFTGEAQLVPGEPTNILLVGSDTREGIGKAEAKKFGSAKAVGGQRSDTMIVLHVDPKTEQASMLSIPRDLFVTIAETGQRQRINTAFEGGPRRLIMTIQGELGIPIDHYVEIDFNGFRAAVDDIGGVNVYFPGPARDQLSGLNIAKGGCVKLGGEQALAFVRSRHYQYYEAGRWRTDGTGDLGRIQRQQDFIRRTVKAAIAAGARNPVKANALAGTAVKHVKVDDELELDDVVSLARQFKSLEPDQIKTVALPVVEANVGGAAVLRLKQPDAEAAIAEFLQKEEEQEEPGGEAPDVSPSSVRARVLNGSGVGGLAGEATSALQRKGLAMGTPGDADSFKYQRTVVRYAPGQEAKGRYVASLLKRVPKIEQDATLKGADVAVVIGADWSGLAPAPGAAPTSTTTSTTAPAKGNAPAKAQGADLASQC